MTISMKDSIIKLSKVSKFFGKSGASQPVLCNINLEIFSSNMVAIKGKSGCGKSTLLNIIAATLFASSGEVLYKGTDIQLLSDKKRAKYRSSIIGYIPQNLYLLEDRNVFYNIALPLQYLKIEKEQIKSEVSSLADMLGIESLLSKEIYTLSGGEKQRVAICRAIIKKPEILIADEPTSSLDDENEALVIKLFRSLQGRGTTIVVATHDDSLSSLCDDIYHLPLCFH